MNLTQNIPQEMLIDPAKILAKLHLSGKSQVKTPNVAIVNSGIVDDSNNGPDKPGKTNFNLDSKTGEYELGIVTDIVIKVDEEKIKKDIGIDEKKLADAEKKVAELKNKQKLTDDNEEVKKASEELEKIQEEDKQLLKKFYDKLESKDDPLKDDMSVKDMFQKVKDKAYSKYIKDSYDEGLSKARKIAIEALGAYMKMFAGDKYKAPKEDNLAIVQVPTAFSGMSGLFKDYVKDFVINGMSDEDIQKYEQEQQKKHPGEVIKTICFKVKFKISKES